MQDPSTATAKCGDAPIYAPCDLVDTDHLNSMHLEIRTAISKLLGEDPKPLDCDDPSSYDQLCRAILAAVKPDLASEDQVSDLKENPQGWTVTACGPDGQRASFPADCFLGGGADPNACPPDADGISRPIGSGYLEIMDSSSQTNDDTPPPQNVPLAGTWVVTNVTNTPNQGEEGNRRVTTWTKQSC